MLELCKDKAAGACLHCGVWCGQRHLQHAPLYRPGYYIRQITAVPVFCALEDM